MSGVSGEVVASRWPRLFHMAAAGSWPSIQRHGLLSTASLLNLFEVDESRRDTLLSTHRPKSVTIEHATHGAAVVRDQKPMSDKGLRNCLQDGLTPEEWYRILNDKVFFWLTQKRLCTMMGARAYRALAHDVLEVNTAELLAAYGPTVVLSPYNSGCTVPFAHPRGRELFATLVEYPWERRIRKARSEPIVELAVPVGVPDIRRFVVRVVAYGPEDLAREREQHVLWER